MFLIVLWEIKATQNKCLKKITVVGFEPATLFEISFFMWLVLIDLVFLD